MESGLTISRAARAADVGVETIRFYERKQLIEVADCPARGGLEGCTILSALASPAAQCDGSCNAGSE